MDTAPYKHLAFLLSLGSVPACFRDVEPDANSASGTDSTTSTTAATTESNDSDTHNSDTASTGGGDTQSSSTGPTPEDCLNFAAKVDQCIGNEGGDGSAKLYQYCKSMHSVHLQISGETCQLAFDAYISCYGMATCDELGGQAGTCSQERQTYLQTCGMPAFSTCTAFQDKINECKTETKNSLLTCLDDIIYNTQAYGYSCGIAKEDAYACLSPLSCTAFESHAGCEDKDATANDLCS